MITGKKLHLARNIMGYSQEFMASKLDCSQRTISKWENGEVVMTDDILEKYLEVLGKDKEWIETLDERINLVQNNNTFNDHSSGCTINNNHIPVTEFSELISNLSALVKAQQEILDKYNK